MMIHGLRTALVSAVIGSFTLLVNVTPSAAQARPPATTAGGLAHDELDDLSVGDLDEALAHAESSLVFQRNIDAVRRAGWTVPDMAHARVDRPGASIDLNADVKGSPAIGSTGQWTRVTIPVARGEAESALRVDLILAWRADGNDEFAVRPYSDEAARQIGAVVVAGDAGRTITDPADEMSTPAAVSEEIAACTGWRESCAGGRACCSGVMSCIGRDNHEKCQCSALYRFTEEYPQRATASIVCVSDDNLFGFASWWLTETGCGEALAADQCGRTAHPPQFKERSVRWLRCGWDACQL